MQARAKVIASITDQILSLPQDRIVKVAIDGVDGAGKTFFADELGEVLRTSGRQIIRASVDGFHNPREVRYRSGRDSPSGFYNDSYNYSELVKVLLSPLSSGGNREYLREIFDHGTDSPIISEREIAERNAILVFDGIFLHRDELYRFWDFSIFLDVEFRNSIARCAQRGDGSPDVHATSNRRYIEGQKMYMNLCSPRSRATVVIDNNCLEEPFVCS